MGGIYGLIALGIVIVNKATGVFNFAHGWMMVVGGMIFWSFFTVNDINIVVAFVLSLATVFMALTTGGYYALMEGRNLAIGAGVVVLLTLGMVIGGGELRWIHAIIGTITGATLVGLAVERFAIRPLIGQPLFTAILMTLAVGFVLQGITQMIWGSVELNLPVFIDAETGSKFKPIRLDAFQEMLDGIVIIRVEFVIAFVLALLAFGAFLLFFRYTNIGLAMRAVAENQQLAESVGLRVRVILAVVWVIATLLAATAGVLIGGATAISSNMWLIVLRVFPAVLLGGLESVGGALVGGLVIGLVEEFGKLLFANQVGTDLAPYLVLMIVLVIRPDGLFGEKRIERI